MNKVSEERMKLRIEYSRETDLIFSDNIPAYADWLENKLALLQPLVISSVCTCTKFRETPMINGKHICSICNKPIVQTDL